MCALATDTYIIYYDVMKAIKDFGSQPQRPNEAIPTRETPIDTGPTRRRFVFHTNNAKKHLTGLVVNHIGRIIVQIP